MTDEGFTVIKYANKNITPSTDGISANTALSTAVDAKEPQLPSSLVLDDDASLVACSQDELAEKFTSLYSQQFRYVGERSEWYRFTGTHWQIEKTCMVFDLCRKICRAFAAFAPELSEPQRRKLVDASNVAGVERLARTSRAHAAIIDQWDRNPWLLNTPGGFVNLRTGDLQSHDPNLYMTKIANVTPENISTPLWDKFMERVQPDSDIRAYLNRRSGYALTGSTGEQALFFDYGTGANGKTVYQKVLLEIIGTYAVTAPMELLIESQQDRHPTEVARLHGARAVGLAETNQGRRWSEDRIKVMTGGDKLAARYMRQDFFEFIPEFKLLIMGNHMPALRNVDEAISRRLQIVGWQVKIPKNERIELDKYIDMLRPEFPGILYQFIQGCLEWQKIRLNPPGSVISKTEEYLHGEDSLARWLEEATEKISSGFSTNEQLYSSWCQWCESQGEFGGKKNSFTKKLVERGYERERAGNNKGFKGIVVISARGLHREAKTEEPEPPTIQLAQLLVAEQHDPTSDDFEEYTIQ